MPSNLYGVANAPIITAFTTTAAVVCTVGVDNIIGSVGPIIAPSQGFYYPACFWFLDYLLGGTLPSNVVAGFKIGAGSYLDAVAFDLGSAVASSVVQGTTVMFGPASSTPWVAPGSTVNFVINPASQSVTTRSAAGRLYFALFRAPDQ